MSPSVVVPMWCIPETLFIIRLTLDLAIEVVTTFTAATVTFHDQNPEGFVRYKAFVGAVGGKPWCSVPSTAAYIRCTITGLEEAVDFELYAEACRSDGCGSAIKMKARTKLQGSVSVFTNLYIMILFSFV